MNSAFKKHALLLVIFGFLFSHQTMAHPIGIMVTNMRYSNQTLTLSSRIFYPDFWFEFQNYTKTKNKKYIKTGVNADDKKDFETYFIRNMHVWINNAEVHIKTMDINFEQHEDDAYILLVDLSYKFKKLDKAKIRIKNTVLLNTIGGQKNMFNFYLKDPKTISHGIVTLDKNNPEYEFVND
jgi:hypothetical protein